MRDVNEKPELVQIKDLVESFSVNARHSNRLWLSVIFASAIVLFPKIKDSHATLPFDLGEVPLEIFYPIGFSILIVIVTSFCQAYVHLHMISKYVHTQFLATVTSVREREKMRHIFMILQESSVSRVFPLVDYAKNNKILKGKSLIFYYYLLKFMANSVVIGIPLFSITYSLRLVLSQYYKYHIIEYISIFLYIGILFPIILVTKNEIEYAVRASKRLVQDSN